MNIKKKIDLALENKIKELLCAGRKVDAVVIVQRELKLGLRNSKELVDELEELVNSEMDTKN